MARRVLVTCFLLVAACTGSEDAPPAPESEVMTEILATTATSDAPPVSADAGAE